jgi:hypothetical protein
MRERIDSEGARRGKIATARGGVRKRINTAESKCVGVDTVGKRL